MPLIILGGWLHRELIYWLRFITFWKVLVTIVLVSIVIIGWRKSTDLEGSSNFHLRSPNFSVLSIESFPPESIRVLNQYSNDVGNKAKEYG